MRFRNPLESGKRFFSEVGSGIRPLYKPELGKNGELILKEDGIEDIYAYIQSFKNSVDINIIISRYASGDLFALDQISGFYGDFINVPSSYMDILNSVVDLRSVYEKSDKNVSFDEFAKSIIDPAVQSIEKEIGKEVSNNVSESE